MNVDVRREHRYRWEVESVVCILKGDFNISVHNVYYPQEWFPRGGTGDVANKYSTKVEEYERTDTAALYRLLFC